MDLPVVGVHERMAQWCGFMAGHRVELLKIPFIENESTNKLVKLPPPSVPPASPVPFTYPPTTFSAPTISTAVLGLSSLCSTPDVENQDSEEEHSGKTPVQSH